MVYLEKKCVAKPKAYKMDKCGGGGIFGKKWRGWWGSQMKA